MELGIHAVWRQALSYHKVPTESLEYLVNHIFLDLFGNEEYCIAYHNKAHSFYFTMMPYL